MRESFIKKYWEEENVWFYIHFKNEEAVRQIEHSPKGKVFLSISTPQKGDSMLYDQSLKDLDLKDSDFITKEEFEKVWSEQKQ